MSNCCRLVIKCKNFWFEIVLPKPKLSSAEISAFNTAEPVCLKIPVPLVLPAASKFEKSPAPPNAADDCVSAEFGAHP